MDKVLLRQLRKIKTKKREIIDEERQRIKEYVDKKEYSLEELECLKIEMQSRKNYRYSVVLPVILSLLATIIFELTKKMMKWVNYVIYDVMQIEETYKIVRCGVEYLGEATGEERNALIFGMVEIFFACILFVMSILLMIIAFVIGVKVVLFVLGGGLHEKDNVYQYYYEAYINEKISRLEQESKEREHHNSLSALEIKTEQEERCKGYDVVVQDEESMKKYTIIVNKQVKNEE